MRFVKEIGHTLVIFTRTNKIGFILKSACIEISAKKYSILRREAVVKIFLPPFGCDLVRPPYVVIDSNLFSLTLSFYFREIL